MRLSSINSQLTIYAVKRSRTVFSPGQTFHEFRPVDDEENLWSGTSVKN